MVKVALLCWAAVGVTFCAAVASACYVTESGWPLVALAALPQLKTKQNDR